MNGTHYATSPTVRMPAAPRRSTGGRLLAHFLTDLMASIAVVLAVGWMFQASADQTYVHDALITQNEIYVALSRFTPHNLVLSYASTFDHMTRELALGYLPGNDFSDAIQQALGTVGGLLADAFLTIPRTIIAAYNETSGTAAIVVLGGFGLSVGTLCVALLAERTTAFRLLLAVVLSPLAISVVFLALQGFMVVMMDMFYWFTSLAPYTVACPVVCTLYWVAFPNADCGALGWLAHAMLRVLEPGRR